MVEAKAKAKSLSDGPTQVNAFSFYSYQSSVPAGDAGLAVVIPVEAPPAAQLRLVRALGLLGLLGLGLARAG